jgi:hypothetical protein
MSFLKSLFSNNKKNNKISISSNFKEQVFKAINVLGENEGALDDDEAKQLLLHHGIPEIDINEIIVFLPIAFVRKWLKTVEWSDTYMEMKSKSQTQEKKYSETESYIIIWSITTEYFENTPNGDFIFKIAGRSSEYKVINQVLNNNPNAKLEDLKLSNTVIIR